jgi:hypothetical protein
MTNDNENTMKMIFSITILSKSLDTTDQQRCLNKNLERKFKIVKFLLKHEKVDVHSI